MNYIKHLNQFMELVSVDDRLTPHHISVYLALFQQWNKNRFPEAIYICRNEIMQAAKVGSTRTYYKCLNALHEFGYIVYTPSRCPITGSKVSINLLSDTSEEAENGEEIPSRLPKSTQVQHGQNRPMSWCKSATTEDPVVTPLLKHNINLLNNKTRERRAHEKKIDHGFLEKKCREEKEERPAGERREIAQSSNATPPSSFPSENSLVSKRKMEVARNFSMPTLEEIKDFFEQMTCPSGLKMDRQARQLEAIKFFHHFESNGWLVGGKSPMRNWKAGCRSWVAKIPYFTRKANQTQVPERKNFHVNQQKNFAQAL
jgi:hypothetical protein